MVCNMKFNIIKRIEYIGTNKHSVYVINKVFSHFQDKEDPTYHKNRTYFVRDMITYLDI
jgi:hypothetical protein